LDALDAGAKDIILTVGGSATNDGGTGLLVLWVQFYSMLTKRFYPQAALPLATYPQLI
jgi:glycerate kinase